MLHIAMHAFLLVLVPLVSAQYSSFSTLDFDIKLDSYSQTLASLSPKILPSFDFSPFDRLSQRNASGNYHVGDITLQYRVKGEEVWIGADSAAARVDVQISEGSKNVFSKSDLSSSFSPEMPLNITREWSSDGKDVRLSVRVQNTASSAIEIGAFGFPIEFNSILTNRTAKEIQANCSFIDPNIGLDGGYLRVTPVSGRGPALVVTPLGKTPFEAWRFLAENTSTPLMYQSETFEGFYSWEVFSKAFTENEWSSATPWNNGTSKVLEPGEAITMGLRFSVAQNIEQIEFVVNSTGTPVAIGIPGYIIPRDQVGTLFLFHNSTVLSVKTVPAEAFNVSSSILNVYELLPSQSAWGRVSLEIMYSDGRVQTVHYYITKAGPEAISDLGNFLTTDQWFTDTSDPFMRAPSVISYDRSTNSQVTQEERVLIAGLSSAAGAGSYLTAAVKQAFQPNAAEVKKVEEFINKVMWGTIQLPDFSVRRSIFFYEPGAIDFQYDPIIKWENPLSWNKTTSYETNRANNYVHIAAVYWSMYRVARSYPALVSQRDWQWYLNQAYQTIAYCFGKDSHGNPHTINADVGLIEETVFGYILADLGWESMTNEKQHIEALMKARAILWAAEDPPYDREISWDSNREVGWGSKSQEGIYYWSNYFNLTNTSIKTIDNILGFMPTVSHWAWNGNARHWSNQHSGKLQRYERQAHHFGCGLNSLPLLSHFQHNPTDIYSLRVGYGGNSGALSNIDEDGFASTGFHTWPQTLAWDAYSSDYGSNFIGLVLGSGTYVVDDENLGLLVFGGSLEIVDGSTVVTPKDAVRRKVYLAPLGLAIEVDAGALKSVSYNESQVLVKIASSMVGLSGAPEADSVILRIEKKADVNTSQEVFASFANTANAVSERGGMRVNLGAATAAVDGNVAREAAVHFDLL